MRKLATYTLLTVLSFSSFAQEASDGEYELNFPEIPSSPAFVLMGVSPTSIESPQTPSDFAVSLQNSTKNLTAIPNNYSLSFAPFWLLKHKEMSYEQFLSNEPTDNILQSLQVSFGVADSIGGLPNTNRMGLGISFSLIRGDIAEEQKNKYFDKLKNYQKASQELQAKAEKEDEFLLQKEAEKKELSLKVRELKSSKEVDDSQIEYMVKEIEKIDRQITERQQELSEEVEDAYIDDLKAKLRETKLKRQGFFLNVAGGTSWDYFNNFDSVSTYRYGAWINFGWQAKHLDWIGTARMLSHDQVIFTNSEQVLDTSNFSTFDVGLKLDFDVNDKASINGEILYRNVPNTDIEPSYRMMLNVMYNVSPDIMITMSFGRDFENFSNTVANANIALLNLVMDIGTKRLLKFSDGDETALND